MISESPWFSNMRNIKTQNIDVANKNNYHHVKSYLWDDSYLFKIGPTG